MRSVSANTSIVTYSVICRSDNISQLWLLKRFIIIIEVRTLRSADTHIAACPAICRAVGCHYTWEVNWSNTQGQRDMTIHGWCEVNWNKVNWERHSLQTSILQPTHRAICKSSQTSLYMPRWSELNWTGLNWTESAPICRHLYYSTPCNTVCECIEETQVWVLHLVSKETQKQCWGYVLLLPKQATQFFNRIA